MNTSDKLGDHTTGLPDHPPEHITGPAAKADARDAYVVLVSDSVTGESDAHGPYDRSHAATLADGTRRDLASIGLCDVQVDVIRLHTGR